MESEEAVAEIMQLKTMPIAGTNTIRSCLILVVVLCLKPFMAGKLHLHCWGYSHGGVAVLTSVRAASVQFCMHAIRIQGCLVCFYVTCA